MGGFLQEGGRLWSPARLHEIGLGRCFVQYDRFEPIECISWTTGRMKPSRRDLRRLESRLAVRVADCMLCDVGLVSGETELVGGGSSIGCVDTHRGGRRGSDEGPMTSPKGEIVVGIVERKDKCPRAAGVGCPSSRWTRTQMARLNVWQGCGTVLGELGACNVSIVYRGTDSVDDIGPRCCVSSSANREDNNFWIYCLAQ